MTVLNRLEGKKYEVGEETSIIDVKDCKVLVNFDDDAGFEMPLPNLNFKPKSTDDKDFRFRSALFKLVIGLVCVMVALSVGRYALHRYQIYMWEKQFKSGNIHVIFQLNGSEVNQGSYDQLVRGVKSRAEQEATLGEEVVTRGGGTFHVGRVDEKFSIGESEWKLDSEDKQKNYSILTDTLTNYTVIKLIHKLDSESAALDEQLRRPLCYVVNSHWLNLPSLANVSKFLDQVDQEAAMIVTKLGQSLFFDVGQPIDLDISKYGTAIHKFCSGATAFQLKAMDLAEEILAKLRMDQSSDLESGAEGGPNTKDLISRMYEVVDELEQKIQAAEAEVGQLPTGTPEATTEVTEKLTQEEVPELPTNDGDADDSSTAEATASVIGHEGAMSDQGNPEDRIQKGESAGGGGVVVASRGIESSDGDLVDAQELHRMNAELINTLHSGNLIDPVELIRQFHQVVAYVPSGHYTLHSPHGFAIHLQIRRHVTLAPVPLLAPGFPGSPIPGGPIPNIMIPHFVPLFQRVTRVTIPIQSRDDSDTEEYVVENPEERLTVEEVPGPEGILDDESEEKM